jgi:hypothetical protein
MTINKIPHANSVCVYNEEFVGQKGSYDRESA